MKPVAVQDRSTVPPATDMTLRYPVLLHLEPINRSIRRIMSVSSKSGNVFGHWGLSIRLRRGYDGLLV